MNDKRRRFEAAVLQHMDSAYRFARWLSQSRSDVDDVVQEAFLRAYRGFDSLRNTDARSWLLAIVRNCYLDAVNQEHRRGHVPLPEEGDLQDGHALIATAPGPEQATVQRDEERALSRLLSALTQQHREVLILREVEELDYRDIAAVTGVPIGTVMSRLARARAALRAQWQQDAPGGSHALS